MERHSTILNGAGNEWYGRMLLATAVGFGCYFSHAVGLESVGYTGLLWRSELLIWLSVGASVVALYCWYRDSRVDA